jgi:hypothetical protein
MVDRYRCSNIRAWPATRLPQLAVHTFTLRMPQRYPDVSSLQTPLCAFVADLIRSHEANPVLHAHANSLVDPTGDLSGRGRTNGVNSVARA